MGAQPLNTGDVPSETGPPHALHTCPPTTPQAGDAGSLSPSYLERGLAVVVLLLLVPAPEEQHSGTAVLQTEKEKPL